MLLPKLTKATVLILFFFCLSGTACAEKVGYETITPPQPTQNPQKIEVLAFFWYGCPHCYSLEPALDKWVKALPSNVEFIRVPAAFNELWAKHAKAYYVAEALNVNAKTHADFFDTIQNKKEPLETEEQLAKFFVAHGVKEEDFHNAWNSFAVDSKMRNAPALAAKYGLKGVPAIIVNGKYKTDGPIAGSQEKILEVTTTLIKQEEADKKAK